MLRDRYPFLYQQYFGNTVLDYGIAVASFFGAIVFLAILSKILESRLRKIVVKTSALHLDGAFLVSVYNEMILPLLYVGAFYFAFKQLVLNQALDKLVSAVGVIALTIQITRLSLIVIVHFLEKFWTAKGHTHVGSLASRSVIGILRTITWGLAVVFIFDNMGFNISAVVAGLGIGGIAVALAAQNILGDLFNYFVIFFDKPFQEGDVIVLDQASGTIENIGIKTTRIRAVDGEQIVVPNTQLTSSKIRNFKRMRERRVAFKIGVIYQTPAEKLKNIPGMIQKIIESIKLTRVDRVHFCALGAYSLDFEIVYFVTDPDYNKYMDIQQAINLKILELFDKEGIEFAYPTQTVFDNDVEPKAT